MIPLKLELKNFMAYRDMAPLDFSGLHVAVLTGENGAGKSTLLDAITWALWGQARAKRDDELIHQGATEMRVALTFSEGPHVYQVVRTRKIGKAAKGKAPTSSGTLDFFVKTADNGWTMLTEARIADTQEKIIRTLNLTYETFINSAYLKQGRADEFTLKPPAQRKAVLSEILNLDIWQAYEARARDRLAALEGEQLKLKAELDQAEAEIARLPEYERALREAQTVAHEAERVLQQAEADMTEIERQRERARTLRAQQAQIAARLRTLQADLDKLRAEREQHVALLEQYQNTLRQREEIERGFAELEQARASNEALNVKLASMAGLNERKYAAERAIAEARHVLERDLADARRRLNELRQLAADQSLEVKQREVSEHLAQMEAARRERDEQQRQLSEAREQQGEAKAQNETLRQEMRELKTRIDALSSVGAICPTCGRELSEEDRARLLAEWQARGKERGDAYRANEARIKQLNERRAQLEARIAELDHVLRDLPALQREHAALADRIACAQEAEAQLPEAEAAVDALAARLEQQDYARDAHHTLAQVTQALAQLGYDAAAHNRLRQDIQTRLAPYAERKAQLDRAEIAIQSEQRALETLNLREATLLEQKSSEEKSLEELQAAISSCERELQREPQARATLERARDDFLRAQRRVGEANQRVQSAQAMRSVRDRLDAELTACKKQQARFEELRVAFGRNGVPAMIIESVLPELEAAANALLGRMTNGRMNVRFETQRLTQKGETSETLEIRISDELGERAYEMFSGGEAFRVNFAIRIALSRLLAHRANARLQTLFIDEGFGTQDAQGRERLIEAIKAIEDDFERIFVITHIDELKDAFPAQIEVRKTPRGSIARVV
ncbi:AAA family ATPase [Candidatus Roseilinea sp. NK_OTU-006]|jgi:exonuclease SbcC|uniref:AAA family ATPase n=1 Tax=Candidatus Roseilinea sp. NK_OTU-006 TaxID=2704250 RepID=UPI00145FC5A2|nr:SMC family ATPase [Candidatus Roseilinea sp. NK_OTU-006]